MKTNEEPPSPLRRSKTKLEDSENKKRLMQEKLIAYYQSLVQPVTIEKHEWPKEKMLDGTDVDAQILKKRAHKSILAEAIHQ